MDGNGQLQDFNHFMKQVSEVLGIADFHPGEGGLVSFSIDDEYIINIQYVPATGKMLVFLPFLTVADLPTEALRELLSANLFGRETGGGWFGLEAESGSLVYHYVMDFGVTGEPDVDDFIKSLEQILELVEIWRVHLTESDGHEDSTAGDDLEAALADLRFSEQIRP